MLNYNYASQEYIESISKENEFYNEELDKEKNNISSMQDELNKLIEENKKLNIEYKKYTEYRINNVKTINQYPKYPTGCEAVSLTILLNYWGINVTVDDVIKKMPQGNSLYMKNDILYGGDPNYEFLGSPYSDMGCGIWDKGRNFSK